MFTLTRQQLQHHQKSLPIDPRLLILQGGMEYDVTPLPQATCVMYRRNSGELACLVDNNLTPQQATLAGTHILGHAMLHQDRFEVGNRHEDKLFESTLTLDGMFTADEERDALMVGLEMIIPKPILRHGFRVSNGDITTMAKAFGVPKMTIRRLCVREGLLDAKAA